MIKKFNESEIQSEYILISVFFLMDVTFDFQNAIFFLEILTKQSRSVS